MWPENSASSIPPAQMGLLEGIHERFLFGLQRRLAEYLELPVSAELTGFYETSFSDFTKPEGHACYVSLESQPLVSRTFIGLPPGIISRVLNVLLGTTTAAGTAERRGITDIETHIMMEFFAMIGGGLRQVWVESGVTMGAPSVDSVLPNPRRLPADESMIVLEAKARIGETAEDFRIAVPALLARFAASLVSAAPDRKVDDSCRQLESLKRATFQVEAVLSGARVRLGDLLALEAGQVLLLPISVDQPFECRINGLSKFQGELIQLGPRQAMEIQAAAPPA